ncbi:MAG: hypothetical protein LC798_20750 [Chloroflexi bacterium]|nr:hypothetical protein [Chloroflexota bacterium]
MRHRGYEVVPNGPLRKAFLASGMRLSDVCYRAGFVGPSGAASTSRFQRALGMRAYWSSRRPKTYWQVNVSVEIATRICDAIGVAFDDLYCDEHFSDGCGKFCRDCGAELLRPAKRCGFCVEERAAALARVVA